MEKLTQPRGLPPRCFKPIHHVHSLMEKRPTRVVPPSPLHLDERLCSYHFGVDETDTQWTPKGLETALF